MLHFFFDIHKVPDSLYYNFIMTVSVYLKKSCYMHLYFDMGFPGGSVIKNPPASRGRRRCGFDTWVRKIPRRWAWQPTPVFLPGESHGQQSLVGYSSQGHEESNMTEATEHAHTYFDIIFKSNVN